MYAGHRDGKWRSADELPRTPDGRVQSFVAINGHGSYAEKGTIPKIFFAFNDQTSDQGKSAALWSFSSL